MAQAFDQGGQPGDIQQGFETPYAGVIEGRAVELHPPPLFRVQQSGARQRAQCRIHGATRQAGLVGYLPVVEFAVGVTG
jgi:hypothetical protein